MRVVSRISMFLVVAALLGITAFAKSDKERVFSVYQDKTEIAKVRISSDKNEIKVIIERSGQFDHIYVKSLATGDVQANAGDNSFFKYNNKSGDYKIKSKQSNVSSLKWSEIQNFTESVDLKSSLVEDMKIFRAVRGYDSSAPTRSFELAYIVLTADESIFWSENSDYRVNEAKIAKIKFGSRLSECTQGCDTRLSNCLRDVQPNQRIECYRIADGCYARCESGGGGNCSTPICPAEPTNP